MPRYFFHFNGSRAHRDNVGEMLDGDIDAWQQSLRMLRDLEHGFQPEDEWRLEVHDHEKSPVFLITVQARRFR